MIAGTYVRSPGLRPSFRFVTVAGCLAMVYVTGVTSPLSTKFFRSIGATDLDIGLLGGIPLLMLFMQFVGAYAANHIKARKPVFMVLVIMSRLIYIPVAFMPILLPPAYRDMSMTVLLLLLTASAAIGNFAVPLWYSWMADLIPKRIMNRYWGARQSWMQGTWVLSFLVVAWFVHTMNLPVIRAFGLLATIGVTAGVLDILLFAWVREPPHKVTKSATPLKSLLAPFTHPEYRTFLLYSCTWAASVMTAAAFMQVYALETLKLPLGAATLIWCVPGIGHALASRFWGRIADRFGQRPVMVICTFFKPLIVVVFLMATPSTAFWLLPMAFALDGVWNAGTFIGANGYSMKIAPRENRSAFMAAIMALTGICGGLASVGGGMFLKSFSGVSLTVIGRTWTNYHFLFIISFFMRLACAGLVHYVRDPKSSGTRHVLMHFRGAWPLRTFRYPVGLEK